MVSQAPRSYFSLSRSAYARSLHGLEELEASLLIAEVAENLDEVWDLNRRSFPAERDEVCGGDQLEGIPERGVIADVGERLEGGVGDGDVLLLAPGMKKEFSAASELGRCWLLDAPDRNNLLDLVNAVCLGRDDEHSVEKIDRNAMWALVLCPPDAGDPAI